MMTLPTALLPVLAATLQRVVYRISRIAGWLVSLDEALFVSELIACEVFLP